MAKVLVKHTISGQVVEIEDYQLAHPHFAPQYKRVRVSASGKIYAWNESDPDANEDTEVLGVVDEGAIVAPEPDTTDVAKKSSKAEEKK